MIFFWSMFSGFFCVNNTTLQPSRRRIKPTPPAAKGAFHFEINHIVVDFGLDTIGGKPFGDDTAAVGNRCCDVFPGSEWNSGRSPNPSKWLNRDYHTCKENNIEPDCIYIPICGDQYVVKMKSLGESIKSNGSLFVSMEGGTWDVPAITWQHSITATCWKIKWSLNERDTTIDGRFPNRFTILSPNMEIVNQEINLAVSAVIRWGLTEASECDANGKGETLGTKALIFVKGARGQPPALSGSFTGCLGFPCTNILQALHIVTKTFMNIDRDTKSKQR